MWLHTTLRGAERSGRRFASLVRAHEEARLAAASLYSTAVSGAATEGDSGAAPRVTWHENALTLRRALLQLTRALAWPRLHSLSPGFACMAL